MPGEVTLTHQLGKEFVLVTGGSQVAYVLLEAKPTALMAQVRMPLNFALVIDHSGSMRGAKLRNVREAVKIVIDRLDPTDYISVVIFDDTAQVMIVSRMLVALRCRLVYSTDWVNCAAGISLMPSIA